MNSLWPTLRDVCGGMATMTRVFFLHYEGVAISKVEIPERGPNGTRGGALSQPTYRRGSKSDSWFWLSIEGTSGNDG